MIDTPRSIFLPEKPIVPQLVKTLPHFKSPIDSISLNTTRNTKKGIIL
jgi:hypothetical protein